MIALPWQIIAAFVGLFAVYMVLNYLRRTNCEEKVDLAKRQTQRETMSIYRDTYNAAWQHGTEDVRKLKGKSKDA